MKKSLIFALLIPAFATVAIAQRQPSAPLRPYIVKTRQSVADLEKSLHSIDAELGSKETVSKTDDVIGGAGMQLRVAVQYDAKKDKAMAEVHDASDDVFYVLEGSAELTLGGALENPKEATPGEWKSEKIVGGKTFTIKKGDLIVIPRGTPHQRVNSKGKKFSLLLIKVFAQPLPPKP